MELKQVREAAVGNREIYAVEPGGLPRKESETGGIILPIRSRGQWRPDAAIRFSYAGVCLGRLGG
jgi:hypothetical protein